MRVVEYLSPTAIAQYYKDPQEYYLRYLSDNRPPRFAQTRAMSIGSSFDAYVKSYLHQALFGKDNDPKFVFENIFEAQVEQHNRDWALAAGRYVFGCYRNSGALGDLMIMLQGATNTPRFEFDLMGAVSGSRESVDLTIGDVILMGKPDLHFRNNEGADVVFDWKVNGYCSSRNVSPAKGYVKLRDGWSGVQSRTHGQSHKDAFVTYVKGIPVNCAHKMEEVDEDWANQLSVYGWLLGLPVGGDFIVAIDQLACDGSKTELPKIRIAEHRTTVSETHQRTFLKKAVDLWNIIHSDHYFTDVSLDESKARCAALDTVAKGLEGETAEDEWFRQVTRGLAQ